MVPSFPGGLPTPNDTRRHQLPLSWKPSLLPYTTGANLQKEIFGEKKRQHRKYRKKVGIVGRPCTVSKLLPWSSALHRKKCTGTQGSGSRRVTTIYTSVPLKDALFTFLLSTDILSISLPTYTMQHDAEPNTPHHTNRTRYCTIYSTVGCK